MKILMIAPEPFFEPRGTPFSEYFRIRALSRLGHQIDLVTYPVGENRTIDGLRILRIANPLGFRSIKTGPSAVKLIFDFFLFFKSWRQLRKEKYDVIHTHEEASIIGVFLSRISKIPHLYDMHSSLVQQMDNFRFTRSRLVKGMFRWVEKRALTNARAIIVICQSLFDYAARITPPEKLVLIENFLDETPETLDVDRLEDMRSSCGCRNRKVVVYTGTLEEYQGIPLLIDAMERLGDEYLLLLVGGRPDQVRRIRENVEHRGLSMKVRLLGKQPADTIPYFLKLADVLVSPRILGTNIPLKIYAYLKSGVPVVATRLYTHTQSLTPEISILVEPDPESIARGIEAAVGPGGQRIAENALRFCRRRYSEQRYIDLVDTALKRAVGVSE